jgi:cation transport ATPase
VGGRFTPFAPVLVGAPPLNLDVRRHDMYSLSQASRRIAWVIGFACLPVAVIYSWNPMAVGLAQRISVLSTLVFAAVFLPLILARQFRWGFELSKVSRVGIRTIVIIAISYLVAAGLFGYFASDFIESLAVASRNRSESDSPPVSLIVYVVAAWATVLVVLPIVISYLIGKHLEHRSVA